MLVAAAAIFGALVAVLLIVLGTMALMYRAERDDLRSELRQLNRVGWYAAPPSTIRLAGHRVGTERDTVLPPPGNLPRMRAEEEPRQRDTWPSASTVREIQ